MSQTNQTSKNNIVSIRLRHRFILHYLPLMTISILTLFLFTNVTVFNSERGSRNGMFNGQIRHTPNSQQGRRFNHNPDARIFNHNTPAQADQNSSNSGTNRFNHNRSQQQASSNFSINSASNQVDNFGQNRGFIRRWTTATGYVALGLLATTLLIGPLNLLRRKRNPISIDLRRDIGIWTVFISVVHVILSFQLHRGGQIFSYFFMSDGSLLLDNFGLANYTGLVATFILIGLATISNDLAIQKLKSKQWKKLHRLNYMLFAFVIAHALLYGALGRMTSVYTLMLGVFVAVVLLMQVLGIWMTQRKDAKI